KRVTATRPFFRTSLNAACSALMLVPFIVALGAENAVAASKPPISTPRISCTRATQTSINVQVCAGATGLPNGFTLQWLKAADYAANGNQWLSDSDPLACSAGFSGSANLSRYNLAPGECVTVNVGDFLFDNGASTNRADCANPRDRRCAIDTLLFRSEARPQGRVFFRRPRPLSRYTVAGPRRLG